MCSEIVAITKSCFPKAVLTGNLEEIGERSALVLTEAPLDRGVRVTVSCHTHQLKGFVKSCRFNKWLGFLVEVALDKESRWSARWFTPQHLLESS
jgi:hypothetical protein